MTNTDVIRGVRPKPGARFEHGMKIAWLGAVAAPDVNVNFGKILARNA